MSQTQDYLSDAMDDAADTAREFLDQIVEQLTDSGEASDDLLNDYPNGDAYHHETHVDRAYNLQDAALLLDQLSDHEETDSGLWEGLPPRDAIGAQAAYTYGNAVAHFWCKLIREINGDDAIQAILTDFTEGDDGSAADRDNALKGRIEEICSAFGG